MKKFFQKFKKAIIPIFLLTFFKLTVVLAAPPTSILHLSWETDGLVPFNYSGKALVGRDGIIKVSLQPFIYSQGRYLNASSLTYVWLLNNELKAQGQNLREFRFKVNSYEPTNYRLKVKVYLSSQPVLEKEISLPTVAPQVVIQPTETRFLRNNGILEIFGSQAKLKATPYFFAQLSLNNLQTKWYLNDLKAPQNMIENDLLLITPEKMNGVAVLVEDKTDSLIRAGEKITLKFLNP